MSGSPPHAVLQRALTVQAQARDIITKRGLGQPLSDEAVGSWMEARRELVNSEPSTGLDALALAHSLLQGIETITRVADEPDTLAYLVEEMAAAAAGLTRFIEDGVGRTRDEIGLFPNFIGPSRQ